MSARQTAEPAGGPAIGAAGRYPGIVCRVQDSLTPEEAERFDGFTSAPPHASYMQATSWVELVPVTRLQRFVFLTCEEDGRLTVAGLARLTRLFPGRYLARFQRGPVFHEIEPFKRALPHILRALRDAGVCTLLMNPRWEEDGALEVEGVLASAGMRKLPSADQYAHSTTGLVDMDKPEEEILAGFQDRCRRDIKRAVKKGLVIRPAASEKEADTIRDRRRELATLRNIDELGQPDLVDQWRSFQGREDGVLLLAEAEGQIIGGLAVVREGDRAIIRGGGALPLLPKLPRTHNLIWESMRMLRADGCRTYDLAGMPDDDEVPEDEKRRQMFKLAFNPRIVKLVPIHCAALRPLEHAVLFRARQWYRRSSLRRRLGPLLSRR